MALPDVKINIQNGGLGRTVLVDNGVSGLVVTGNAVPGKVAVETSYQIFSLREAQDLGITYYKKQLGYDINVITASAGGWFVYANTMLIGSVTATVSDTASSIESALLTAINSGSSTHGFTATSVLGGVRVTRVSGAEVTEIFSINAPINGNYSIEPFEEIYDNRFAEQHIKDFYSQAGTGRELWVFLVPYEDDIVGMLRYYAPILLDSAGGRIRLLGVAMKPNPDTFVYNPIQSLEASLIDAISEGQLLAESYQQDYKPVSILIDGIGFNTNVSNLYDLRASGDKRYVSVVLGASEAMKNLSTTTTTDNHLILNNVVGLVLGRLAGVPVQRNIGRVRDGDVGILQAYLGASGSSAKNVTTYSQAQLDSLNDKGYIFLRQHTGLNGFYFNDDHTATPLSSDFSSISRVRVIEKARLIARATLLQELLDEVPIDGDTGKLDINYVASIKAAVETAINVNMTTKGEIISVTCVIDPNQNILATDKLEATILITPVGIAKQIEVDISYNNPLVS